MKLVLTYRFTMRHDLNVVASTFDCSSFGDSLISGHVASNRNRRQQSPSSNAIKQLLHGQPVAATCRLRRTLKCNH